MTALYHLGLTVEDLDRSISFYRDIVGMELEFRLTEGRSDEFDTLTDHPGSVLDVAHLKLGPFVLQLIQYVAGGGKTLDLHHHHIGSPHLCFYVDAVDAKFRALKERGDVLVTSDIVQITPNSRSFYTEDPDGVPVEFLEMTGETQLLGEEWTHAAEGVERR